MIHKLNIITFGIVVFIGTSCSVDPTATQREQPDPPRFILKSDDQANMEYGIDAIPEGDGIFLIWQNMNNNQVKWTKIYRRAEFENGFQFLTSVNEPESTFVDYDLELEMRYYYYLKSVDKRRFDSLPSDTLSYMLLPKATNLNHSLDAIPTFVWHYPFVSPVGFLLRLEDVSSNEVVWMSLVTSFDSIVEINYNWDNRAMLDSIPSGRSFRWRVDVLGPDLFSGSESVWKLLER